MRPEFHRKMLAKTPEDSPANLAGGYTPQEIRGAYNVAALPSSYTGLTAAQAAALGAGQTVYVLDAYAYSNVASDLAYFSSYFGLPACTASTIAAGTSMPLPSAPTSGCNFSTVSIDLNGAITNTVPSYDTDWSEETALDVQWVHATAPLARIILIQTPDASGQSFLNAVALAKAMGPGVVSMSFTSPEGSWETAYDASFTGNGMTYAAAAGDAGDAVNWPAVSPYVVAVGGTSLNVSSTPVTNGSGDIVGYEYQRVSETVWSGTGGGVSAYEPIPSYQDDTAVPGEPSSSCASDFRAMNDVAFNADPNTGQYIYVTPPGGTGAWGVYGGTSLATPQWAGLFAVVNAQRLLAGKALLGDPHVAIYDNIGDVSASYAADFFDITIGDDGSCSDCSAGVGYDLPTGFGTPDVTSLLNQLVAY